MTVSRALNSPQLVRPKNGWRKSCRRFASQAIHTQRKLAGGLASRRSKLIAVVVPQINNNMFVDTIQSLSDELARRGYHILLCVAGYTEQTEAELVTSPRRPDGVVLPREPSHDRTEKGHPNAAIPVVEIWDLTPTPLDMLVGFSHEKSGRRRGVSSSKYYRRPGLLWTADRRAAQRAGYVVFFNATAIHAVPQVDVPFRHRFRWGAAVKPAFDEGTFDVIVCSSDTPHRAMME